MNDIVLEASTLLESLSRMINATKVRARRLGDGIYLLPEEDTRAVCPLRGFLAGYPNYTSNGFMERKHEDKKLDL
jgi:hypothetical protein